MGRWILLATCAVLSGVLTACHRGPDWLEWRPVPTTAWLPFIEDVEIPGDIHALRDFYITLSLSTDIDQNLLNPEVYTFIVKYDSKRSDGTHTYTYRHCLVPQDDCSSPWLQETEGNRVPLRVQFSEPGNHVLRIPTAATREQGGTAIQIAYGPPEAWSAFTYHPRFPDIAMYREYPVTVLPPEDEDLFYIGYIPYIEDIVAPVQLLACEPSYALVRMYFSNPQGSGEMLVSERFYYPAADTKVYECFSAKEPSACAVNYLVGVDGHLTGPQAIQCLSALSKDESGIPLAFMRYPPDSQSSMIRPGEAGFTYSGKTINAIPRKDSMHGDEFTAFVPAIESVDFPEQITARNPEVIRVNLSATAKPEILSAGFYALTSFRTDAQSKIIRATIVCEPGYPQALAQDSVLCFIDVIHPGDWVLRITAAATAADSGTEVHLKRGYELQAAPGTPGIDNFDYSFTVLPASDTAPVWP